MAEYLPPLGSVTHEGIDVSEYQGNIDFERVKNSGRSAVYIRAGLGNSYTDPYFERNYRNATAAGMLVGFYHFVTARTEAEARQQARFFGDNIRGKAMQLRPAMDFESFDGLTPAETNAVATAFLDALAAGIGREPVIYTGAYNARALWNRSLAEKYPLWAADYGPELPEYNDKWRGWVGFQYSNIGSVPGVRGHVDLDRFTEGILLSNTQPVPPRAGYDLIEIIVRRGDTLTAIARRYNTSVSKIVCLNDISNPDRIIAGRRLLVAEGLQ